VTRVVAVAVEAARLERDAAVVMRRGQREDDG
jgi:hypothetical protein